ncbi:hypothetical protein MD484_g4703, partial [Candolleomyces efflorescens]
MGSGKALNAVLRKNASKALFPILRDLGIQAALTHMAGFALHRNTTMKSAKEIKVVVNHKDKVTLKDLCTAVASDTHASTNGYFIETKGGHDPRLDFFSADPQAEGKACRVTFIHSGGSFPKIIENFDEIVVISEVPVLPIHAILLEQLTTRSLLPASSPPGKVAARFVKECLLASGDAPLQQLSPLWRSQAILDQIALHIQDVPDEAGKDADGGSDLRASKPSSTVEQAHNVATVEPGHGHWHSAVTDVAARHVVDILKGFGIKCAVFGSAASQLYSDGRTRVPEQLDILILRKISHTITPISLKKSLFRADPGRFEWKNGILLYLFSTPFYPSQTQAKRACKVEILSPAWTVDLPNFESSDVIWVDDLPVAPFFTLLMFKLQVWGNGYNLRSRAHDVKSLLQLISSLPASTFRPGADWERMSAKFRRDSGDRVKRFCSRYYFPETRPTWRMLGFRVESN